MATVRLLYATPGRKLGRLLAGAAVLAAASWLATACVDGDVPAAPGDDPVLVEGQAVYAGNCANCHGTSGGGGRGTRLDGRQVLERYPDPADQLEVVANGSRAMPGFGEKLTGEQLEAVVRYTREVIAEQ